MQNFAILRNMVESNINIWAIELKLWALFISCVTVSVYVCALSSGIMCVNDISRWPNVFPPTLLVHSSTKIRKLKILLKTEFGHFVLRFELMAKAFD
jgi:hypothetical protein